MTMLRTDEPSRDRAAPRPRLVAVLILAAVAGAIVTWASLAAKSTVSQSTVPDVPSLSEERSSDPPAGGAPTGLEAVLPGISGTMWLVMPAAGGTAELWVWPTVNDEPILYERLPDAGQFVDIDPSGRFVAVLERNGDLALGTPAQRRFLAPEVTSIAWHPDGDGRIAWIGQPQGAPSAQIWTASVSTGGAFSRLLADLPDIVLNSPVPGDGAFLVAHGDWGFVVERSLPTENRNQIVVPRSQVAVISPEGRMSKWVDGRLIAAAPDGRLLLGEVNVLSGTYRLHATDPLLRDLVPVQWVSIGDTAWSPDGARIFNLVDAGPPTASFDIRQGDTTTRFRVDVQFIDPLGWSTDGRYFVLGVINGQGRELLFVDAEEGELVRAPIGRLPRAIGLSPAGG